MARKEKKLLNTDYTSVMSPKLKVAVVVSNFNSRITERLLKGAVDFFMSCGMNKNQIQILYVPGAFEIPQVCARLCEKRKVRGIVTLGAVIRGETTHYDYVCSESARGIMDVGLKFSVPITYGILTCDTEDQALERAGGRCGNKGEDCARALLDLLKLRQIS